MTQPKRAELEPTPLDHPALVDTGVWTWVRDRRFPELARWFNEAVRSGQILICDLIVIELVRMAANEQRAREVADRLEKLETLPMGEDVSQRAREIQLLLARAGDHRRVPPADLLIAATAERANATLLHYDRDYERIATVTNLRQAWFVPDGTFTEG